MSKGTRWIKRVIALSLVLLLSIESFGAIVSDNDGSAFITKAEFDSLKNDFQAQIDNYNTSIDNKIDGAIAAYLAGIRVSSENMLDIIDYYKDGIISYDKSVKSAGSNATSIWTPKIIPISINGKNEQHRRMGNVNSLGANIFNYTGAKWGGNDYDCRALIDGDLNDKGKPFKDASGNKYFSYKGWSENGRTTMYLLSTIYNSSAAWGTGWYSSGTSTQMFRIDSINWILENTDMFDGSIKNNSTRLWQATTIYANSGNQQSTTELTVLQANVDLDWGKLKRERVITIDGADYEYFTEKSYLKNVSNFNTAVPSYDKDKNYKSTNLITVVSYDLTYYDINGRVQNVTKSLTVPTTAEQKGFPAVGVVKDINNWDSVFIDAYDGIAKDLYEANNSESAVIKTTESPANYHLRTWAGWPLVKMSKIYAKGEYTVKFNDNSEYYVSLNQGPFGKSFDGNIKFTGGEAVPGKNYRKIKGSAKISWELDNHDKDSYIFLKWSKTNNELKGGGTLLPEMTVKLIADN